MMQELRMIEEIKKILIGIDQTELENPEGWWETSAGAEFGANKLKQIAEALAQPEQEPVAILHRYPSKCRMTVEYTDEITEVREGSWPLYTTPPQSKPLTDEEIILIVADCASSHQHTDIHFARAIERAHGIKELV